MRYQLRRYMSIALCTILCLTGCGKAESTANPTVTPTINVSGESVRLDDETMIGYHHSNLDINKHSVWFPTIEKQRVSEIHLDKGSTYSFLADTQLTLTGNAYSVLLLKDDEIIGSIRFDELVMLDVEKQKRFDYSGDYLKYSGFELPTKGVRAIYTSAPAEFQVYINRWSTLSDKSKCADALYITCDSKENLLGFLKELQYSVSDKKYLDVEKEVMTYLVGGGSLTFTIPMESPWYMGRIGEGSMAENSQYFAICKNNTLWTDIQYTPDTQVYMPHSATEWVWSKGNIVLKGEYSYVADSDPEEFDEEEQQEHMYCRLGITDVLVDGKSVYRGQMLMTGKDINEIDKSLNEVLIEYSAG